MQHFVLSAVPNGTVLNFSVLSSRGWSGGAKVLGKLSMPGRPTTLDCSRASASCACSRCGWGFVCTFFLSSIISLRFLPLSGVVGWCDGAGLTSSAGASYVLRYDYSRAGAYCACSRCGWETEILSQRAVKPKTTNQPIFPSLWETARYRLKYCLKGSLSPKTTNQLK